MVSLDSQFYKEIDQETLKGNKRKLAMDVQQVLHMNGGERETSYANNSILQRTVIDKAKPIIEEAILNLYSSTLPQCLKIADLGCSSGPNTLLLISEIIDTTDIISHHLNRPTPEFHVFLNDLPGNDFNTIFKSLPTFYEKLKKEKGDEFDLCFITGMPGSFYGRLFPSKSLHFVHSSYSLHWLSRVPQGLETDEGTPLNKGDIYLAKTSPPSVLKSYLKQFQWDFSLFLRLRSEEIIPGGRMVLTFMSRKSDDPSNDENCTPFKLLASALNDMVIEGLVDEAKLDSFNVPYYAPSAKEIRNLIEAEGSFKLHRLNTFEVNWNGNMEDDRVIDKFISRGQKISMALRAAVEPILVSHFGESILDDLFGRFTYKAADLLTKEESKSINQVVSMIKK